MELYGRPQYELQDVLDAAEDTTCTLRYHSAFLNRDKF